MRNTMSLHSILPGTSKQMTLQPFVRVNSIIGLGVPWLVATDFALP
jgi:hypothetical protein